METISMCGLNPMSPSVNSYLLVRMASVIAFQRTCQRKVLSSDCCTLGYQVVSCITVVCKSTVSY